MPEARYCLQTFLAARCSLNFFALSSFTACSDAAAQVYHLSRSGAQELILGGQVFLGGRIVQNTSAQLSELAEVSVRHYGKFRYIGPVRQTRKGNLRIRIERYV